MSRIQNYLIVGGTGRQGSAVLTALLTNPTAAVPGTQIYAVTRDPFSTSSQSLLTRHEGVHLIEGSLDDPTALFAQLPEGVANTSAVYLMQPDDPAKELANGKAFVDAARQAGVPHLVYSSVDRGADSDNEPSFVPGFEVKYHVERHLKDVVEASRGEMSYTIVRPVFFMDNLRWGYLGKVVATGVRDQLGGKVQMVAARDVGRWAAEAMLFPDEFGNKGFSIAGDEFGFSEADAMYLKATGEHIGTTYWFVAAAIIYLVGNVNKMFRWFKERPAQVDIAGLAKRIKPTTFQDWAQSVAPKKTA